MRISKLIFATCLTLFLSCNDDKRGEKLSKKEVSVVNENNACLPYILKEKENNLNISILLDLSDRIEESKTIEKDSAYLTSLSKSFINHVKKKKLLLLEDRMQLFFNPEPSDEKINELAQSLKVVFTKETSKSQIEKTLSLYAEKPAELYHLAKDDAISAGGYPGSDIWRFFKDNVKDYCIDECHRNILVILSDGYMYYDGTVMNENNKTSYLTPKSLNRLRLNRGNWEEKISEQDLGFIPATNNLSDLEVLVIGITSHNKENPYAQDIIETYWKNWFKDMGVKRFKIKNADIPTSIEKIISDFINKV